MLSKTTPTTKKDNNMKTLTYADYLEYHRYRGRIDNSDTRLSLPVIGAFNYAHRTENADNLECDEIVEIAQQRLNTGKSELDLDPSDKFEFLGMYNLNDFNAVAIDEAGKTVGLIKSDEKTEKVRVLAGAEDGENDVVEIIFRISRNPKKLEKAKKWKWNGYSDFLKILAPRYPVDHEGNFYEIHEISR